MNIEISVCVNNDDKVIGIFTEGDFRRAVFKKIKLDTNIKILLNKNFIYLTKNHTDYQIEEIFNKTIIQQLPILDDGCLINIIDKKNYFKKKKKRKYLDNLVVIMAGGKGTRLDPFTRILPKPLIPFGNEAIIKVIMDRFNDFGIENFKISINEKSKMIKAYFSEYNLTYNIDYIEEKEPLGTIGSIRLLNEKVKKPFFVTNCDIILRVNYNSIMDFHLNSKFDLTVVAAMHNFKVPYGVCEVKGEGNLITMKEKPSYDFLINTGVYIFNPKIIEYIPKNKHFDINELLNEIKKKKLKVGVYPVYENDWVDVGHWKKYDDTLKKMNKLID